MPAAASSSALGLSLPFEVDVELTVDLATAGESDSLDDTVDYSAVAEAVSRVVTSEPAPNGLSTVINMQMVGNTRYFDAAGFPGRTVGLSTVALPSATQ